AHREINEGYDEAGRCHPQSSCEPQVGWRLKEASGGSYVSILAQGGSRVLSQELPRRLENPIPIQSDVKASQQYHQIRHEAVNLEPEAVAGNRDSDRRKSGFGNHDSREDRQDRDHEECEIQNITDPVPRYPADEALRLNRNPAPRKQQVSNKNGDQRNSKPLMKCDSGHPHGLHGTKSDEHHRIEHKDDLVSCQTILRLSMPHWPVYFLMSAVQL